MLLNKAKIYFLILVLTFLRINFICADVTIAERTRQLKAEERMIDERQEKPSSDPF